MSTQPVPLSDKKIRVRIVNPYPDGNSSTSLYHAKRHVKRGRARFDEQGRLLFLTNTEERVIDEEILKLREQCAGYDRVGRPMTLKEIAGIPVVMPEKLMFDEGGTHSPSHGRSGPVRVLVANGEPVPVFPILDRGSSRHARN
jgi:hypothetical protein